MIPHWNIDTNGWSWNQDGYRVFVSHGRFRRCRPLIATGPALDLPANWEFVHTRSQP